jgi:hypothetical protein
MNKEKVNNKTYVFKKEIIQTKKELCPSDLDLKFESDNIEMIQLKTKKNCFLKLRKHY